MSELLRNLVRACLFVSISVWIIALAYDVAIETSAGVQIDLADSALYMSTSNAEAPALEVRGAIPFEVVGIGYGWLSWEGVQLLGGWPSYRGHGTRGFTVMVPLWLPAALFLVAHLGLALPRRRLANRRRAGSCLACGYNLRGLQDPRCPECGVAFDPAERRRVRPVKQPLSGWKRRILTVGAATGLMLGLGSGAAWVKSHFGGWTRRGVDSIYLQAGLAGYEHDAWFEKYSDPVVMTWWEGGLDTERGASAEWAVLHEFTCRVRIPLWLPTMGFGLSFALLMLVLINDKRARVVTARE